MRRIAVTILLAVLLLAAALAALDYVFNRPPVNMEALNALKQGTPREEVQRLLGRPTSSYEGSQKWAYSKPLGWSIVYVYFNEQGQFKNYEYDY